MHLKKLKQKGTGKEIIKHVNRQENPETHKLSVRIFIYDNTNQWDGLLTINVVTSGSISSQHVGEKQIDYVFLLHIITKTKFPCDLS